MFTLCVRLSLQFAERGVLRCAFSAPELIAGLKYTQANTEEATDVTWFYLVLSVPSAEP
jgi:hypothetical protein